MANFVTKGNETVRLFQNRWLEALSHVHPATPLVFFLPVISVFAVWTFRETAWPEALVGLTAGVLLWTLVEYWVHRSIFHYQPRSRWGKWLAYIIHGAHHDFPGDRTRLVTPLSVSIPLAALFYLLFRYLFSPYHLAVFTGFVFAYLAYDLGHYALHHWPIPGRLGRSLKGRHLRHHFTDPHSGFGVTSPLWDFVFRTLPSRTGRQDGSAGADAQAEPAQESLSSPAS